MTCLRLALVADTSLTVHITLSLAYSSAEIYRYNYDPEANFPQDISNLLPAPVDRWWETLGKSCSPFSGLFSLSCTAADACQSLNAPDVTPCLPKVRLILLDQARVEENVEMEVDELEEDDYVSVSDLVCCLCSSFLTVSQACWAR